MFWVVRLDVDGFTWILSGPRWGSTSNTKSRVKALSLLSLPSLNPPNSRRPRSPLTACRLDPVRGLCAPGHRKGVLRPLLWRDMGRSRVHPAGRTHGHRVIGGQMSFRDASMRECVGAQVGAASIN